MVLLGGGKTTNQHFTFLFSWKASKDVLAAQDKRAGDTQHARKERFRSPLTMPLDAAHAPSGPLRRLDFPAEARSPAVPRAARCPPTAAARERATHSQVWWPPSLCDSIPRILPPDDDNAPPGPLLRRLEFPAPPAPAKPERLRRAPPAAFSRAPSSIAPVARARGATPGSVICHQQDPVKRVFHLLRGKSDGRQDGYLSCQASVSCCERDGGAESCDVPWG